MQTTENLPYPYSGGWPRWPFGQLSETDMQRLLAQLEEQRWEALDEIMNTEALF